MPGKRNSVVGRFGTSPNHIVETFDAAVNVIATLVLNQLVCAGAIGVATVTNSIGISADNCTEILVV